MHTGFSKRSRGKKEVAWGMIELRKKDDFMYGEACFRVAAGCIFTESVPFVFLKIQYGRRNSFFEKRRHIFECRFSYFSAADDIIFMESQCFIVPCNFLSFGRGGIASGRDPVVPFQNDNQRMGAFPDDPCNGITFVAVESAPMESGYGELPGSKTHIKAFRIADSGIRLIALGELHFCERLEALPDNILLFFLKKGNWGSRGEKALPGTLNIQGRAGP